MTTDPLVTGVRHLKIWVSDLARSRTWVTGLGLAWLSALDASVSSPKTMLTHYTRGHSVMTHGGLDS